MWKTVGVPEPAFPLVSLRDLEIDPLYPDLAGRSLTACKARV
jgi:hypothetical protein